ncbi:MAG TPA: ATP-binding protein [Baekduia sp.]|nr:ATP-binding protein [Baekduia sp.]
MSAMNGTQHHGGEFEKALAMRSEKTGAMKRRPASTDQHVGAGAELAELRATCRRQAHVIDKLDEAMSTLRQRLAALTARSPDVHAENDRLRRQPGGDTRARDRAGSGASLEVRLALDGRAPGAARDAVAQCLRGDVSASLLDHAQLAISELVGIGLRHSGKSAADGVLVRVTLAPDTVCLEIEYSSRDGVIASPPADADRGEGLGLDLVQALSERWGLERVTEGPTRVWALLLRTPTTAAGHGRPGGAPPNATTTATRPGAERRPASAGEKR